MSKRKDPSTGETVVAVRDTPVTNEGIFCLIALGFVCVFVGLFWQEILTVLFVIAGVSIVGGILGAMLAGKNKWT